MNRFLLESLFTRQTMHSYQNFTLPPKWGQIYSRKFKKTINGKETSIPGLLFQLVARTLHIISFNMKSEKQFYTGISENWGPLVTIGGTRDYWWDPWPETWYSSYGWDSGPENRDSKGRTSDKRPGTLILHGS